MTVILANANKKSEIMKGEGDGKRNKIFADAFGKDPQFFAFYRAMQAYEKALIGGETSSYYLQIVNFSNFLESLSLQRLKRDNQALCMSELLTAIGLIFFLEGLLLAIFPSRIKSMLELIKNTVRKKH